MMLALTKNCATYCTSDNLKLGLETTKAGLKFFGIL
jgi:hypothetical protein